MISFFAYDYFIQELRGIKKKKKGLYGYAKLEDTTHALIHSRSDKKEGRQGKEKRKKREKSECKKYTIMP